MQKISVFPFAKSNAAFTPLGALVSRFLEFIICAKRGHYGYLYILYRMRALPWVFSVLLQVLLFIC